MGQRARTLERVLPEKDVRTLSDKRALDETKREKRLSDDARKSKSGSEVRQQKHVKNAVVHTRPEEKPEHPESTDEEGTKASEAPSARSVSASSSDAGSDAEYVFSLAVASEDSVGSPARGSAAVSGDAAVAGASGPPG